MDTTPNLVLPYILPSQAQKHVTHNEAIASLDALVQLSVASRIVAIPPASPAEGARHIVGPAPTGSWTGKTGKLAVFEAGGWLFHEPRSGWTAYVEDEGLALLFDGTAWVPASRAIASLDNLAHLGIGTTADAVNPFAAKLNKALWTARTAGEGGDGDLRTTLNKEAAPDVLSMLFQQGFSGRAELGLIGDNDFVLKVSADGSAWKEAMRIGQASGVATFPQTGSLAAIAERLFRKADPDSVALTKTGAGTVSVKAGTVIALGGRLHEFATATAVQMPTLSAGTDYAVYLCGDGTVRADTNFTAPAGFDATTSRRIGGFHYAAGGNATGTSGGNATASINEYSLWDLGWRPACANPRGMALVAGAFWCDIYMTGANHHLVATSVNNATIADGASLPVVPAAFGGNGSTLYTALSWFEANDIMTSHGKRLPDYAEFAAAAYGVTENVARGNDPVTTGFATTNAGSANADEKFTSKSGIIQATGCGWIWGRQPQYLAAGADAAAIQATSYKNNTGSRGQIFSQNTSGLSAVIFGGGWGSGVNCGSRASSWANTPWSSASTFAMRGVASHAASR